MLGAGGSAYLQSSGIWGKANIVICALRHGGRAVEDSRPISLVCITVLGAQQRPVFQQSGAHNFKNLVSEGERAKWRWAGIVLSPNYLIQHFVLRSQPIQFTYIWLPLSKMHTLDDTICYIRFTTIS